MSMVAHVDVADSTWLLFSDDDQEALRRWLTSLGGDPLVTYRLELGEGYVTAYEFVMVTTLGGRRLAIDDDEPTRLVVRYPARTPPPVWPTADA